MSVDSLLQSAETNHRRRKSDRPVFTAGGRKPSRSAEYAPSFEPGLSTRQLTHLQSHAGKYHGLSLAASRPVMTQETSEVSPAAPLWAWGLAWQVAIVISAFVLLATG